MKTILLFITFSQFFDTLKSIGLILLSLLMALMFWEILRFIGSLFMGLFAFVFGHRANFYRYFSGGVFYAEKFLKIFFIKFYRNKKWALEYGKVGHVYRSFWRSQDKSIPAKIYTTSHGQREEVAHAIFVDDKVSNVKKVDIHMVTHLADGTRATERSAVGYVDQNGDVYKYFLSYDHFDRNQRLVIPVKIGSCRNLTRKSRKDFATQGEDTDAGVLGYIVNTEGDSFASYDGINLNSNWFSFRMNHPKKKEVQSALFDATRTTGIRRFLDLFIYKFINVIPLNWTVKSKPYGYGFVKQNHHLWKNPDLNEISLLWIGGAALLLLEEHGFYKYEDDSLGVDKPGWAETALISLLTFLSVYHPLLRLSGFLNLFPFIGAELSLVVSMFIGFLGIWGSIRFMYEYVLGRPYPAMKILSMLNTNTGAMWWSDTAIVIALVGFICSFFWFPLTLTPAFGSMLFTLILNRNVFPQRKWPVRDPFRSGSSSSGGDTDPIPENFVERVYEWEYKTTFSNERFSIKLSFDPEQINILRKLNPFSGTYGAFCPAVKKMLEDEMTSKLDDLVIPPPINPTLTKFAGLIDAELGRKRMTEIDRINAKLAFVQQAISYRVDGESEPLIAAGIFENKENREYCRYSRETLYDQEGDCDCKAELAAALYLQAGSRVAYVTSQDHAAIGISAQSLGNLRQYFPSPFITWQNEDFLFCETTAGGWLVGEPPKEFTLEDMFVLDGKHFNKRL